MGKRNILVIAVSVIGLAVAWALFAVATGAVQYIFEQNARKQGALAMIVGLVTVLVSFNLVFLVVKKATK